METPQTKKAIKEGRLANPRSAAIFARELEGQIAELAVSLHRHVAETSICTCNECHSCDEFRVANIIIDKYDSYHLYGKTKES
jgi:hypothetical protein